MTQDNTSSKKHLDSTDTDYRGVIWVSGYSAAGKTTVGRILESKLKKQGMQTIFLDGDHLRSIFAGKWGYEREERVELAHIYLRLCSHLASQGSIVILSAVALYQEASEWFHLNIPRRLQVYLNVPEHERRRRDVETKKIYSDETNMGAMYDEPRFIAKYIDNFDTTPEEVAEKILHSYLHETEARVDFGRAAHWNEYYKKGLAVSQPSPFARSVLDQLPPAAKFLELGCGNGRDCKLFADYGHQVTGIDLSREAIAFCQEHVVGDNLSFRAARLPTMAEAHAGEFDVVYSRFVVHAMPLVEELAVLQAAKNILRAGGQLFIECRSINDPMSRQGEVISPTERICGHYRRFIVLDEFHERIEAAGFRITSAIESNNLAVQGDDNPVVIRITAQKTPD